MICPDARALVKFIKPEKETEALRSRREGLPEDTELISSELALLEITRALLRGGVDHTRVPYFVRQATKGIYVVDLSSTVPARTRFPSWDPSTPST